MRAIAAGLAGLLAAGMPASGTPPSRLAGAAADYRVVSGDSFNAIAARFGEDVPTLARRNGLAPDARLPAGTVLRIDAVHIVPVSIHPIVVNISQRMLFVGSADGVRSFPVAVGRRTWPTPQGDFTVATKETDPTWDVPVSIQEEMRRAGQTPPQHVPPSPENPLGAYWIGLSLPGIGIHGTNAPASIYRAVTHGCIRVHPDRIAELFGLVTEGDTGEIVNEPVLITCEAGTIYAEVHADVYGRRAPGLAGLKTLADRLGAAERVDWDLAAEAVRRREGIAVDVTAADDASAVRGCTGSSASLWRAPPDAPRRAAAEMRRVDGVSAVFRRRAVRDSVVRTRSTW
jgi:L,D-transpeptidase ErfK/SrfK